MVPIVDARAGTLMITLPFRNRAHAASELVEALNQFRGRKPLVLAIPRGAVPMARIIADALGGELDVVLVKKIGAPDNPELAIGAIDEQGNIALTEIAEWLHVRPTHVQAEAERQLAAIRARRRLYRSGAPAISAAARVAIIVDDGLATGATMAAALKAVRRQGPAQLICAIPVASADALVAIKPLADATICLATPEPFGSVGRFYLDFHEVSDDAVVAALANSEPLARQDDAQQLESAAVRLTAGSVWLDADVAVPAKARGLVLFAHGSGSSRRSVRNQSVARSLNQRGFATLLFDLLTPEESMDPDARFNVQLLARRLRAALDWARAEPVLASLPVGLFGASTGAAAALLVAAALPEQVAAVVSRGGRPDMAGEQALSRIRTPTLLIVGGQDHAVIELNRAACAAMHRYGELMIHPGATHLFEEPGALEQVASLAGDFFERWLPAVSAR